MELDNKNIKKILLIITFTVLLYGGLQNFSAVKGVAGNILGIIAPFILGLCIAFIINMLMRALEDKWDKILKAKKDKKKGKWNVKLKRPVCLILSIIIILGVISFLFLMVIPEIGRTAALISELMPVYTEGLKEFLQKLTNTYADLPEYNIDWDKIETTLTNLLSDWGKSILGSTVSITTSIFKGIFKVLLGIVFSIYVLLQKEALGRQFKKLLKAYLPKAWVEWILDVADISSRIFSKFVTGQLTEAVIMGILCFIGMSALSIPYSGMISTLVGFTALIPVFGAFIGTAVGVLLIVIVNPMKALWFIIFIFVLQQLEGNLIYPKVIGKSVGLPGIWVLVAVIVGGSIFGILGMLLSVPISSVIYALLSRSVNKRTGENNGGPL